MANCKKCGTEITNAVFVKSQTAGAVSEKLFSNGDAIIAINGKNVKNQADIKKAIEENKFFRIKILHKDKNISTTALIPVVYLNDITFKEDYVCLNCGAKKKGKKLFVLIGIILILILLMFIFINKSISKQSNQETMKANTEHLISNNKNSSIEEDCYNIISEKTLNTLEEILKDNMYNEREENNFDESVEIQIRKRSGTISSEVFSVYDEYGNLLNLRDTYIGTIDLNDGITFNIGTRNQMGEASNTETKIRTRKAPNRTQIDFDSIENTLNTITEIKDTIIEMADISDISEKIIAHIYFPYGSSLDPTNMELSIEKYLLIKKQAEDLKPYSSIVLGLNDLINKIPKDKKESAVFILIGYADTTLFNAIPEISERSNKYNIELSKKRAETIKAILENADFGISSNKIVTQGVGYSKNAEATDDLWKYRRVDVVISYQ